jgi:hypothetical protein
MMSSFFRFSYFSGTNERTPSRIENVIACGFTDRELLECVNLLMGSNPGDLRREAVGPLSTDTRLLNKSHREINWRDLSHVVENAQKIDDGALCLFLNCRLIAPLDELTTEITGPGESCNSSFPHLDRPFKTVYLASAYDHIDNVPVAPIYLMNENSFKNAIIRFLTGVEIAEFNEICIFKCDRILSPAQNA